MKKLKFYLKDILYFFIILFLVLMILTTFNYFNVIDYKIVSIISFIITIILFMYSGIKVAKKSERKGYKSGLITSLLIISIFLLLSLLTNSKLSISVILYYFIFSISGVIGGMFGINLRKK